jgi:flagellar biosynthesis protein FlhF
MYTEKPLQSITVKNIQEARSVLYGKFGHTYNIIKTKPVLKGGFLGFCQKEYLTVYYQVQSEEDTFAKNREEILKKTPTSTLESVLIKSELDQLDSKMNELLQKMNDSSNTSSETHKSISKIEELLDRNEFSLKYINYIKDKIKKSFSLEELEDFDIVQRKVVDWIGESINIAQEQVFRKPYVGIIVGPTGVGKTTTLVKLAVQYILKNKEQGRKVDICFITIDSMRVGAFEQLARFGDLLNITVKKAEKAEDVKFIYEEVKSAVDAIFIDTSGYSPNDAEHLGAMKMTLSVQGMNPDVYLAVCASTKARDIENIMRNYEPFGYKSVIITKCDESEQYGNIISVLFDSHKSVSYITNGQQIAQGKCIKRAEVVDFLVRLEDFQVDRIHIEDKFGVN